MGRINRRTLRIAYALTTVVGVALHELAHKWFAEERGLAVTEVTYFQLGQPAGYVRHETPATYRALLAVSLAPFLVNSAVGIAAFVAANWLRHTRTLTASSPGVWGLFAGCLWLGAACCLHAFPSRTDLGNITDTVRTRFRGSRLASLGSSLATVATRHWSLWLLVAPLRGSTAVVRTVWFGVRHLDVVLTLPLVAAMGGCSRTRRYGSHVVYTALVFWIANVAVTRYAPAVSTVLG